MSTSKRLSHKSPCTFFIILIAIFALSRVLPSHFYLKASRIKCNNQDEVKLTQHTTKKNARVRNSNETPNETSIPVTLSYDRLHMRKVEFLFDCHPSPRWRSFNALPLDMWIDVLDICTKYAVNKEAVHELVHCLLDMHLTCSSNFRGKKFECK